MSFRSRKDGTHYPVYHKVHYTQTINQVNTDTYIGAMNSSKILLEEFNSAPTYEQKLKIKRLTVQAANLVKSRAKTSTSQLNIDRHTKIAAFFEKAHKQMILTKPAAQEEMVTIYHVTTKQSIKSIKKEGFKSKGEGPFQSFKSAHIGAYGFAGTPMGLARAKEMALETEEAIGKNKMGIIKISVPKSKFKNRFRPDEDWSLKPQDWTKYKEEGSLVILGEIPTQYIEEVKLK